MAIASHIRHSMSTDFLELSPLILARPSATKFYHAAGNDKCSKTLHELNNLVLSPCYWLCQMLHYLMNEIFYKISFILRPYKIIYFFYLLNHSKFGCHHSHNLYLATKEHQQCPNLELVHGLSQRV